MLFLGWLFRKHAKGHARQEENRSTSIEVVPHQQFEMFGDRQLLSDVPYVLPKDLQEVNRLDFQHFVLRQAFKGNYLVPLDQPRDILDVGSGTGRWCYEMAESFPQAFVIGCDLLEQAIDSRMAPPNYRFVEADVLKRLPFSDQSFDYVHQRLLFLAMPTNAWLSELGELARITRPGGWIELVETDIPDHHRGTHIERMSRWIIEVCRRRGIDPSQVPDLGTHLSSVGMKNVTTRAVSVPLGHWGGRIGSMVATNALTACQAMKPLVTSQLGISSEEYEHTLMAQQREWEELHMTSVFYTVSGQRPGPTNVNAFARQSRPLSK